MKQPRKVVSYAAAMLGLFLLALWLTACQSDPKEKYIDVPGLPGSTNVAKRTNEVATAEAFLMFRVGDSISITFAGMEPVLPRHEETIKDDGTITPPEFSKSVVAAGKTAVQLQKELLVEYRKIYNNPTVIVNPAARFYYVFGDVNHQGPQQYLGVTDIVMAIASAGGLTEFAKKSDIQLIRAGSSTVIHIDGKKAVKGDPKHDWPIYPGDKIIVPRSIW